MSYATANDIRATLKSFEAEPDDSLKNDGIDELIDQETVLLDAYLATRYTLPITDPKATKVLKTILIYKTLVRIEIFLKLVSADDDEGNQAVTNAKHFAKNGKTLINDLKSGKLKLPGVDSADQVYSHFGQSEYGEGNQRYW